MTYTPRYFKWHEFMPSAEYERLWLWLIDDRILRTMDAIREHYGKPVTINNWFWGGQYKERGLRSMTTTTGAKYSQHKFGRAVDFHIVGIPAETIRNDIRKGLFPLITCIEKDVNWVHIDVRNENPLYEVSAK